MKNERPSKEVTTPSGATAVFYEYITGGELRKIQALYTEGLTAQDVMERGEKAMEKIEASVVFKAQELALRLLLVSVNGSTTEEAFDKAMNLSPADLDYLIAQVDAHTSGNAAKKNLEAPSPSTPTV